jgi:tetratricopeptide (TPR) repeat protein
LVEEWIRAGIPSATYWRSVFTTFEANVKDEGAPLPTHMLRALPKIKADLRSALKERPDTHFFGPTRVLGVIDLSAPVIVGGDSERAFRFIGEAFAASPRSTLNQIWYSKALIRLRRESEAKDILRRIVELSPRDFDPNWVFETEEDQAEAVKILGSLQ